MHEKEPPLPTSGPEGTPEFLNQRVEWLKEHASPIESLDPNNENFSDLEPFKKLLVMPALSC